MPNSQSVELWTLYSLGVSFTFLRTYARIVAVGIRNFRADDYLIWLAMIIYTVQCSLGYTIEVAAHGLANDGMTPEQRESLSPDDPEYSMRVFGSKIQIAGWTTATCLLWTLKLCVSFFYFRLAHGLERYRTRIYGAIGLIAVTWLCLILTIYLACRPFNRYWQINPDPGNLCYPANSRPVVWVMFIGNVTTDVFLFLIPIPMLWGSTLRLYTKFATTMVLSAGILIVVCAVLKSVFVLTNPVHGGQAAASWGTRETFIAVITTNLPMVFPLVKVWFAPWLPSTHRSDSNHKAYIPKGSGFVSIGGGISGSRSTVQHSSNISAAMMFDNDSEENMGKHVDGNNILVSTHVEITSEDTKSVKSARSYHYRGV